MFSLEVLLQTPNSASVSDENGKSLALHIPIRYEKNRIWIVLMTVSGGDVMVLYYLTTDERSLSQSATESPILSKPTQQARPSKVQFNPFCNVDQVELSIHCHINAVKSLLCVPGMVPKDLSKWYIYIYIYSAVSLMRTRLRRNFG